MARYVARTAAARDSSTSTARGRPLERSMRPRSLAVGTPQRSRTGRSEGAQEHARNVEPVPDVGERKNKAGSHGLETLDHGFHEHSQSLDGRNIPHSIVYGQLCAIK